MTAIISAKYREAAYSALRFPTCQCVRRENTARLNVLFPFALQWCHLPAQPACVCTSWKGPREHELCRASGEFLFGLGIAAGQLTGRGLISLSVLARPRRGAAPLLSRTKDGQTDRVNEARFLFSAQRRASTSVHAHVFVCVYACYRPVWPYVLAVCYI